jgi:hypothetical protein
MSLHRATLFVITALFTAGMTSIASAQCCGGGWGTAAPVVYAAPVTYANTGCGGCGTPAIVYAQPVVPAPVVVNTWGTGCGCQQPVVYAAPTPIYVVNQGPDYTGPGVMIPQGTYSPDANYAEPEDYPYVRHHYYHPHTAYREHYDHPHFYRPMPRWRWHRPLDVRG